MLPAFVLLAGAGVAKLPRREASWAAAAALVVLSAIGVRNWYDRPSLEDYRAATHHVLANERPGDGVVYYPAGTLQGPTSGFAYYEARAGVRGPARCIRLHRWAPAASASDLAGHAAVRHPRAGATEVAADARTPTTGRRVRPPISATSP